LGSNGITYGLDVMVDLLHASFAALLIPWHHVDELLVFLGVSLGLVLVNLDVLGVELDFVNLTQQKI